MEESPEVIKQGLGGRGYVKGLMEKMPLEGRERVAPCRGRWSGGIGKIAGFGRPAYEEFEEPDIIGMSCERRTFVWHS